METLTSSSLLPRGNKKWERVSDPTGPESVMDTDGNPHPRLGSAGATINQELAWCQAIIYRHTKYCLWSLVMGERKDNNFMSSLMARTDSIQLSTTCDPTKSLVLGSWAPL